MTAMTANTYREGGMTSEERMVIFASSLGTVFEWYDFYIYGTLAPILAATFFSGVNPTAAFIFTLLAFAAGFAVRPFGALFFGRLGDTHRPQIHLPHHDDADGHRHLLHRPAAVLRLGRHHRASDPDRPTSGAGPRARR